MTDLRITGLNAAQNISQPAQVNAGSKESSKGFDEVMQEAIGSISQIQNDAEKAAMELSAGGDLTQAMVAMEKADMSFQLMVEVRNKLLNAYDEIMRMQV